MIRRSTHVHLICYCCYYYSSRVFDARILLRAKREQNVLLPNGVTVTHLFLRISRCFGDVPDASSAKRSVIESNNWSAKQKSWLSLQSRSVTRPYVSVTRNKFKQNRNPIFLRVSGRRRKVENAILIISRQLLYLYTTINTVYKTRCQGENKKIENKKSVAIATLG